MEMHGRNRQSSSGRHVALLFASFSGGGIERSMLQLSDALLARGIAVDLVVGQAKGELRAKASPAARIVELGKASAWRIVAHGPMAEPGVWRLLLELKADRLKPLLRRLPPLVDYLRSARPKAVLAAEPRYNTMSVWARRLSRLDCRIVLSEHVQASRHATPTNPWADAHLRPLLRRAYLQADAIVAVSDGVADDLAGHAGIPRDRITTVYNPVVGPDLFAKARERLDHPWFAPGQPPVVLAAGRLTPQKDFATLIRAFAQVRARRPARLVILGAGDPAEPYAAELRALATALGVSDDVDTPGFSENPFAYMRRAAVFVLSSVYEGLGNVLIEALACGTPVASTDCPSGPREILDHGRFGPLVPVGDDAALARAIEATLDDPPPASLLIERAQLFGVQRAAQSYLDLLLPEPRHAATPACPARLVPPESSR